MVQRGGDRAIKRRESHLLGTEISTKVSGVNDFEIIPGRMFSRKRHAEIYEEAGVYLTGD